MSERSERLAASEGSLAEKVVRSITNQLVYNINQIIHYLVYRGEFAHFGGAGTPLPGLTMRVLILSMAPTRYVCLVSFVQLLTTSSWHISEFFSRRENAYWPAS